MIENYPCGIAMIRDGKFFFLNQAGIKIFGYEEPADLVGRNFETLIVPSHQKEILEIHAKMLRGIPVQGPGEIPVIRKDGTQIYLSIDMSFVSMFKGPSIVCYYRDITETRQTEKYLQKRLEQLRLILQGSRDVFFDWDVQTGHVEHGGIYSEMLGYDPGELKPHIDTWRTLLHPEDKESAFKALQDHLEGKTDFYESEHRIMRKSGDYIWIEARGMVTMRDEEGNPIRVSGTHVDITRRKMLEMEIASTREDLERLVVEKTNELNETNTALKVLLKQKENEKAELEDAIVTNISGKLHPHISRLRSSGLRDDQIAALDLLEQDVQEIISPFLNKIRLDFSSLTPRETQIMESIKNGKKSKDIADEFNISIRTVDLFRYRIRKKLNISGKKVNLESFISAI